jgi:hypothetical protein
MFYFTMYLYFVGIVEHRVDLKLDIVKHDIIAQCELHVNIAKHFSTNKKKKRFEIRVKYVYLNILKL